MGGTGALGPGWDALQEVAVGLRDIVYAAYARTLVGGLEPTAIPRHVDPDSEAADRWYGRLPLDPYAATAEAEFFAVAAEAFFVEPETLAASMPALFDLFRAYFRQDDIESLLPWRERLDDALLRNFGWLGLGELVVRLSRLVTAIVLARTLAPLEAGKVLRV